MASTNLNLVRSICAEWERGDYSSTEWAHPEIELVFAGGVAPGSWRGLAGMAEGWRGFLSTWDEFRQQADEYVELDHERVLVLFPFSGRAKASGLELGPTRSKGAGVFHLSDRKVTRFVAHASREQALADLELSSLEE